MQYRISNLFIYQAHINGSVKIIKWVLGAECWGILKIKFRVNRISLRTFAGKCSYVDITLRLCTN